MRSGGWSLVRRLRGGLHTEVWIRKGLIGRLTLTSDLNIETTCHVPGVLVSDCCRQVHGLMVPDGSRTVPIAMGIMHLVPWLSWKTSISAEMGEGTRASHSAIGHRTTRSRGIASGSRTMAA